MIDINDAVQTAYALAYAFHASLHQAEAGSHQLSSVDVRTLVNDITLEDSHRIDEFKRKFLIFLLNPSQDYDTNKTALHVAIGVFEKQVQLFSLEGVRSTTYRYPIASNLNTIEGVISFAEKKSSELSTWKEEVEQTIQEEGLPTTTLPLSEESKEPPEIKEIPNEPTPPPQTPPSLYSSDLKNKIKLHKLSREHLQYLQNKMKPFDP